MSKLHPKAPALLGSADYFSHLSKAGRNSGLALHSRWPGD